MKEALSKALAQTDDASVDRILAASFWMPRAPRGGGALATVIQLADARALRGAVSRV